jgi:hypothetical protein
MRSEQTCLDLDDEYMNCGCPGVLGQTPSIPNPVCQIGGHLFDDGELRILKILIAQHRKDVLNAYREGYLDRITDEFFAQEAIDNAGDSR